MPDYYGSLAGADAYHLARGNADWTGTDEAKAAALVRGSQYIDGRYRKRFASGRWMSLFPGVKTGSRAQSLEWPRTGAVDYEGAAIGDAEVPTEVEQATYEATLRELVSPGSLSPDYVSADRVTKEKVGPIELQYGDAAGADAVPTRPVITAIDEIIAPVLTARYFGPGVVVV